MAEVFGAIAAGIGIGSELIRLGCAVQKAIKRIKDSRKDIEKLANETIIFAGLYQRFLRTCEKDSDAYTADVNAVRPLISWARGTLNDLNELLDKVKALYPQHKSRSALEDDLIARAVWFNSKKTVKALRASLSVARESINGFSNLMCLKKLNDQIRVLKEALNSPSKRFVLERKYGTTLEERIQEFQADMEDTQVVHCENKKTIEKAKHRVVELQQKSKTSKDASAPEELVELTETLDEYAREVLPTRRSTQRTHSSASSSSSIRSTRTYNRRSQTASHTEANRGIFNRGGVLESDNDANSSSSDISNESFQPPIVTSNSVSEVSAALEDIPNVMFSPRSGVGAAIERPGMRAREYVNDPTGDILSPPIVQQDYRPSRTRVVGDHTIRLNSTRFYFNDHQFHVRSRRDYDVADRFFSELIKYNDKLNELEQELCGSYRRGPDWKWSGIPGWEVTSNTVTMLPMALGIHTIRESGSFGAQMEGSKFGTKQ